MRRSQAMGVAIAPAIARAMARAMAAALTVLALCAPAPCRAQPGGDAAQDIAAQDIAAQDIAAQDIAAKNISAAESAYSQSFVTGDTSVAQRLVDPDFLGTEPDGRPVDKAGVLADVTDPHRPDKLVITALVVRVHGDTAIALGTEEDSHRTASRVTHMRWLDSWRRTQAGWRLIASAEYALKP